MKSVLPEPPESLVFAQTERDASVLRTYLRRSNAWLRVVDACLSRSRDAESLSDLCMVWARAVVETQGFNLVGAFERHGDSLEPLALIGPRPIREESLFAFDPKVGTEGRIGAAGVPVLLGTDRRELPLKYGMWGSFSRAQGDLLLVAGYDARMALLMEPPGPDGLGYLRMTGQHLLALDTEMSARAALAREHEMLQTVNDRLLRSEDELRANNSLLSLRSEELELALGTLRATQVDLLQSERLSAVGHVAAGVAHEVNNPLAYVIDDLERACELIGSQDDAGEATMLIAGALQGLEHIGGIVRELGRFSNADAPGPEVLQVDKLIESVRQLASNQLRELTHFSIALADPSLAVLVNGQQTRQILLNLMGNALRAVEGMSSRELRLAVSSAGEDAVQFTVSDNGSGIDDSVRERIFEPFITSRLGAGGTGLGLSIARQLAFANGGELDLVSSGPDGTCFRLTVPRVRVESGVPDVVVEPVPRLRVLLIDDDARVLKAHARKLSKRYQVNAQLGGEAGLAALLIGDHDVVLCDLMMPDIGGLELYRAVVETQAELAKRIVFVTGGVANAADRLEIERLGLRVVGKPIDMGRLAAAIAEVLGA